MNNDNSEPVSTEKHVGYDNLNQRLTCANEEIVLTVDVNDGEQVYFRWYEDISSPGGARIAKFDWTKYWRYFAITQ